MLIKYIKTYNIFKNMSMVSKKEPSKNEDSY